MWRSVVARRRRTVSWGGWSEAENTPRTVKDRSDRVNRGYGRVAGQFECNSLAGEEWLEQGICGASRLFRRGDIQAHSVAGLVEIEVEKCTTRSLPIDHLAHSVPGFHRITEAKHEAVALVPSQRLPG